MTVIQFRALVSDDGMFFESVHPADIAKYPGWTDCTGMSNEEFQRFVAERQAVRPYIVGMAV